MEVITSKQKPEFWAEEWEPRDHCYKLTLAKPKHISNEDFEILYNKLGEMGYRFRDAGHCSEKIVISLNQEISEEHKKELSLDYLITKDNGNDLGSARA